MACPPNPALLTVKEVMERLRVGKDAIYELIDEGKLEAFQRAPNCRITITARSVDLYLARIAGSEDLMVEQMVKVFKWLAPADREKVREKIASIR